jgi:PAS domain S-box-containing protein
LITNPMRDQGGAQRPPSDPRPVEDPATAAQRIAREGLAFNRLILDSVSAEIAVLDGNGVILAVNQPWQRVALENGSEPAQPAAGTGVGANYLAVCCAVADADAQSNEAAVGAGNGIRAVLTGQIADFQMELPCHSPHRQRWFSMSVTPLGCAGAGVVVAHTDITNKRKQAEIALQKSNELFQSVLDNVPARVFWKDRQSCYLGCNKLFANDAGCADPDALSGRTDLDLAWADQAELYRADDQAVMDSGRPRLNYEEPQTTPDGDLIWLRTSKVPMRDEDHQVIGILGVYEDITDAKRSADELDRHRHHLEELVETRTCDLEAARTAADRANRAKTEFISTMSHELRSPLNAILGFAQLLEFEAPPPTPTQQDSITQIVQAGWHLLTLINDILDLGKVESGRTPLTLTAVPLTEIAGECCDMIEPQAQQQGIRVTRQRISTPQWVRADRTRVKQVLINLLSHAVKYNSQPGTIEVDCAASTAGRIRVSVTDSGAGLSPEQLTQIFQPFNRLGQEKSGKEGTGIGLVLAKRLVELMGGVVGVDSTVGVGSVFWFELVATDEPLTLPQPATEDSKEGDDVPIEGIAGYYD